MIRTEIDNLSEFVAPLRGRLPRPSVDQIDRNPVEDRLRNADSRSRLCNVMDAAQKPQLVVVERLYA